MQNDNIATCIRTRSSRRSPGRYWLRTVILSNQLSPRIQNRRPSNPPSAFSRPSLLRPRPSPHPPSCKDDSAVSQRPAVFSELPFNASPTFPAAGREQEKEGDGGGNGCAANERKREREKRPAGTRRERSLVNARENWLLNLAAGMSAAHPPSDGDPKPPPPSSPPLPSHDPFPQVQ